MRAGSARFLMGAAIAALFVLEADAADDVDVGTRIPIPEAAGAPPGPADIGAAPSAAVPDRPVDGILPAADAARPLVDAAEPAMNVPPAAAPGPATASSEVAAPLPSVDALVPVPEAADLPPPGIADLKLPSDDPALGEALKALLAERAGVPPEEKRLREALLPVYQARGFKPLWIESGALSGRGESLRATLSAAAAEGLDPTDYAAALRTAKAGTPAVLAEAELRHSIAAVTYARHAMAGRVDPSRVHPLVTPRRPMPKPDEVLAKLAAAADAGVELAAFTPPHAGYRALKQVLAEMRAAPKAEMAPAVRIAAGESLKPGGRDARVPALRARLGVAGDPASTVYDPALVAAVKAFQEKSGLSAEGVVGPQTVAALNGGATASINDIIANMERWRWLPRELGDIHIMVNIPEFTVRIWRGGQMIHRTRVVTGRVETPTPVFTDNMEYIVVNPAWNVPPSIVKNEMMPLLATNPDAITRQGLEVLVNGRVVDPYSLQFTSVDPNKVAFRQPPGERNALGRIKFMFPNQHHVYLHDTPSRHLFARDVRAFSHGCIRVFEPLKFGEVVFGLGLPGESWPPSRIEAQFGGEERFIKFRQQFPVHVVYFTAMVDETGALTVRDDIYRHNAQVKALLGLEGAVRPFTPPVATKPAAPLARPEPPSFLEQLFGVRPARGS